MRDAFDRHIGISWAKWRTANGIRHRPYYIRRKAELQRAGELGNAKAYCELASLLEDGIVDTRGRYVVKPALKKAFNYFQRAAELGSHIGLAALGYCYDNGDGVKQNKKKALYYYTKAWKADYGPGAASNIATIHRDWGNLRLAYRWYRKAADTIIDGDAYVNVGYCLCYGIGVRRNKTKALDAFRQAYESKYITEFGREEAYYHAAVALLDKRGGCDKQQVRELLENANVDDDYPEAGELLAQLNESIAPVPCRCRRHLKKSIPGHAACAVHRTLGNK